MHALVGHSEFGCVVRRSVNYYVMDVMRERCDRCSGGEVRYLAVCGCWGQGSIMHCQPVACSDIAKISELCY